ncbi:MAG: carbamoyltransferase HypF [Paludibacterium sp.]|uniref:carbamoyltransferase HypF n=1 Tax=Paludibacterium sp. TaxID=1917523 RepID=UPI0025CE123D|nr:carbamoyltransferase HypF [Paludibacterium sp.]MBV8047147.1 carbamoyltransferase HypF [Paludibacterium sp.]MBV8647414.1 carbamoyltransferase HypF [Paludibacterium sp.]
MTVERQRLVVRGVVQGVGFRPFVYRLATELGLSGWVRNDALGVTIEAQGTPVALSALSARLRADKPPLARIDSIETTALPPQADALFAIRLNHSGAAAGTAAIGPDSATCPACLAELFDPGNRRYRYPFINCTDCGPRYTLVRHLPYERSGTSMAAFPLCERCQAEYEDPLHRRFHAEPNACPDCGPRLTLIGADGAAVPGDAIAATLALLRQGRIVAIKGLGGFHLACDANHPEAVARLRARKDREAKPLAVMVANSASLDAWVDWQPGDADLLGQPARPIVLLQKRPAAERDLPGIAPGLAWLGAMLPYTPLHYLLFHEAAGRPSGLDWLAAPQPLALVMTSANPHGEPLVIDNDAARTELAGLADAILLHDRAIVTRCDDSVLRQEAGRAQFLRRGRGYTPLGIPLSRSGPAVLAMGGFYKNALCAMRGDQAFLSQHIGDLDRVAVCLAQEGTVSHLLHLLQLTPQAVAHDLHPDFHGTRLAQRLADEWRVPAIAVQHHHAHIAAVLAEHGVDRPVLGLALDGVGLGDDGQAWGGELLLVDGARCRRLGHLRSIGLPGGDRAAREPWRMASAALALMGRGDDIAPRFAAESGAPQLAQMLARGVAHTTSMGRWFDAAAGLLGVAARMRYEGQAAMLLEGLAARHGPVPAEPGLYHAGADLDLLPLLARLADETDAGYGAALFHAVLIEALADWTATAACAHGLDLVACGGGCWLNALLSQGLARAFEARGLRMLTARQAPPGDGGLALGQAWVARHVLDQSGRA